jgi:nematocidal protein AidA
MSEVIDIFINIDTESLINAYPNPSTDPAAPTGISHNFAYMVAPSAHVKSGQATGDLTISADVGDNIRWRMLSMSGNTSFSANLMNLKRFSGGQVTSVVEGKLIEPQTPVPEGGPGNILLPPTYVTKIQDDFYLSADVVTNGTENYNVSFAVLSYHNGNLKALGYFVWDPTITAS